MVSEVKSKYRYILLVFVVLIQICLGATYSWSVFVEPLKDFLKKGQAEVQLPFSLFYNFFPIAIIICGFIQEKLPFRIMIAIGVMIFGSGWLLGGIYGKNLPILAFCIGGMGGIGVGFVYVLLIKLCVLWFPRNKGLASGIAVSGFGLGSALISQFSRYLMEAYFYTPLQVMRILGTLFLIICIISSLFVKLPPIEISREESKIKFKSFYNNRVFVLLYIGMFSGLMGGFAIIANLKQIYPNSTALAGATAVSIFAIFNSLGRVIWGFIHDKFSGKLSIIFNLLLQSVNIFLAPFLIDSNIMLYIFAGFAGINYGGVLVLYASESAHFWGSLKFSKVYGWIFTANILASVSPIFSGFIYDKYFSFTPAFISLSILMICISVILYSFYPKSLRQNT